MCKFIKKLFKKSTVETRCFNSASIVTPEMINASFALFLGRAFKGKSYKKVEEFIKLYKNEVTSEISFDSSMATPEMKKFLKSYKLLKYKCSDSDKKFLDGLCEEL